MTANRRAGCKFGLDTALIPGSAKNILCNYTNNPHREEMTQKIVDCKNCCPNNPRCGACVIDITGNKCVPPAGFICGTSLMKCPINYVSNGYKCIGRNPKCDSSDMMLNLTDGTMHYILCGPRWYYG